jgi:hypothetical protein
LSVLTWQVAAIALEAFQLAILLFHDWIPLGRLNDVPAVHGANTRAQLLAGTFINSAPATFGLWRSIAFFGHPYPRGLMIALWLIYGILLIGEIRAWWYPYFFGTSRERVERYRIMFGRTHALLPPRNGIVPNTLHVSLHAATFATLLVLTQL